MCDFTLCEKNKIIFLPNQSLNLQLCNYLKANKNLLIIYDNHFAIFITYITHIYPPTFNFFHIASSQIKSI